MKPIYIILIATAIIFFLGWKGCSEEKAKNELVNQFNKLSLNSALALKYYKDDSGRMHSVAEDLVVDKLLLEQQVAEQASLLKIKPKQIKGDVQYITNTDIIKQVDTVYKDGWVEIRRLPNDTIKVHLIDTIEETRYWKRKWFLAPKKYFVDITNRSPYVTMNSIKALELAPKRYTVFIGPSLQYNILNNKPAIGFSILYAPFTLKF